MADINDVVSTNVLALMKLRSVTRKELCEAIKANELKFGNYLQRKAKWDINIIHSVSEYFDVEVDYLVKVQEDLIEKVATKKHDYIKAILKENKTLKKKIEKTSVIKKKPVKPKKQK